MKRIQYLTKCDGNGCDEAWKVSWDYWDGMEKPTYLVPEGWNSVRLNVGRELVYCPKHYVGVEVTHRFKERKEVSRKLQKIQDKLSKGIS